MNYSGYNGQPGGGWNMGSSGDAMFDYIRNQAMAGAGARIGGARLAVGALIIISAAVAVTLLRRHGPGVTELESDNETVEP